MIINVFFKKKKVWWLILFLCLIILVWYNLIYSRRLFILFCLIFGWMLLFLGYLNFFEKRVLYKDIVMYLNFKF